MAFANSFVVDLTSQGKTKDEILGLLRNEKYINQWIFQVYKQFVSKKDFKKFIKYVYLYLQEKKI